VGVTETWLERALSCLPLRNSTSIDMKGFIRQISFCFLLLMMEILEAKLNSRLNFASVQFTFKALPHEAFLGIGTRALADSNSILHVKVEFHHKSILKRREFHCFSSPRSSHPLRIVKLFIGQRRTTKGAKISFSLEIYFFHKFSFLALVKMKFESELVPTTFNF
jgi:hypothetical protein